MSSSWERPIGGLFPLGGGGFGTPSQYGAGAAFTVAPTGALGRVTTQIMTIGTDEVRPPRAFEDGTITLVVPGVLDGSLQIELAFELLTEPSRLARESRVILRE